MWKKIAAYTLIFVLLLMSMGLGITYADNDAPADTSQQQAELNAINQQRENLKKEINSGKALVNSLNKEIKDLENKISMSQLEIETLSASISKTETRINEAYAALEKKEAEIAVQNKDLNARLRAMYKGGSMGYLDVLLGSSGIMDFMTNLDRVQKVYDADKEVLDTLREQREVLDAQREYLDGLKKDLEKAKKEEADKKAALDADKGDVADKKSLAAEDLAALEEQEDALVAEANALASEIRRLQSGGDYKGGPMSWPAPGVSKITSEFGNRTHPILKVKKLHTGLDIGCPRGTTVVAAADGTVVKAAWNNSYGNMILIDHGGNIMTLYAHNDSLLVSTGTVVSRGTPIAKSGSTGMSTGPHLHFEVRVNGDYVNPRDYVSP